MRYEVGAVRLHEVHPGRRTTREHGEHAAFLHPVEQLGGFFHDGQVGGESGVEYRGEADVLEGGREPFERSAHILALASALHERRGHRRRDLDHHDRVGVTQLGHHRINVRAFHQRAGGADAHALAAVDASRHIQPGVEPRGHLSPEASAREVDGSNALHLLAHRDAAPAQHAFVGVAPDRGRRYVDGLVLLAADVPALAHAEIPCQFGQFTTAGPRAREAILRMVGHEQLDYGPARFEQAGSVCPDDHAFGSWPRAARLKSGHSLHLHHTEAAGSRR